MEEGGLRKKKGLLGRALFNSLMWSLGRFECQQLSLDGENVERGGKECTRSYDQCRQLCGRWL